jgi:hypothetical protein
VSYSRSFISLLNFELAFKRVVRGQNKEYKNLFRHLYPSYQLGLSDNLEDLIDDIKRGHYEPSAAPPVYLPKKNGILRPLRLLKLQDQIVYQAIANVIARAFKPEQDKHAQKRCFGALVGDKNSPFFYRGWKGCYRAFDRAITKTFKAGNDFVADFDLVSFYELIDHKLLREVLEQRFKDQDELVLLFRCLEKWTANRKGACLHHGIPQGPEPSAFLAECFLFSFDVIRFKDVVYLRYVDDIKLMAKTETPVRRALLKLDIASKELGLVPQAQKIECRQVRNLSELRKNIPSRLASLTPARRVTGATQRRLERVFRRSIKKERRRWIITDDTKFKFALARMNPRQRILKRVAPLLDQRPDLSWVLGLYLRKFPKNKRAADALLSALKRDPTYDASAANYIEAMDACEPVKGGKEYRRVIQTAERRSEEKGLLLRIASTTFRGRRSNPSDALKLVEKQTEPLAKSILLHRLYGADPSAPFTVAQACRTLEAETLSTDPDLARYCADRLLDLWPWSKASWTPSGKVNRSVKLLLKALGIRSKGPKKEGILERFFRGRMRIGVRLSWRKALGKDWRDAEKRCLRLSRLEEVDPTSWVLMLDTFNEVLIQAFSARHPATSLAFKKATPTGQHHPDLGNWLNHPDLASTLPKGVTWFKEVHDARVRADLAHAKSKKGAQTKPISYDAREKLRRRAPTAWVELITEWKNIL